MCNTVTGIKESEHSRMDDNHDGCKGGPFIVSVDLVFEMRKEEGQFACLDMVKCACDFKLELFMFEIMMIQV